MNRKLQLLIAVVVGSGVVLGLLAIFGMQSLAWAASEETVAVVVADDVIQWAFAAAAASAGLSALAAGYAVAHVGSAAVGALAEKPELMGRALVLVGLAEGIAIYGLIVAILILNQVTGG